MTSLPTVLVAAPASAALASLYVAQSGSDGADCATASTACATLSHALSLAADGATVHVSGTIHDHVSSTASVTITGAGAAAAAVIDGGGTDRTLSLLGTSVRLSYLTVTGGRAIQGAGLVVQGNAVLDHVSVVGNTADVAGGGILSAGTLTLLDSSVSSNSTTESSGYGGAAVFAANGSLTAVRSTFDGNNSAGDGGALSVYSNVTAVTIDRSTISGNYASGYGGAMNVLSGATSIVGSTIVGNTTYADYSAIQVAGSSGRLQLVDSTVAGNIGGTASIEAQAGVQLHVAGSIVDGNGRRACLTSGSVIVTGGYNLFGDGSCTVSGTDRVGSAVLGPLQPNGGPTKTQLPAAGGPAAGLVPAGATFEGVQLCGRTDQRGIAAPVTDASACTAGAAEVVAGTPPTFAGVATSAVAYAGQPFSFTVHTAPGPLADLRVTSDLPSGVTFTDNRDGTGTLAGTPVATGSTAVSVHADDGVAPAADRTFTILVVKASQDPLSVTSTAGTAGTALLLTTRGGSGEGAVTFTVAAGTASGCAVTAATLRATSSGTCVVTATKAADATYAAASSPPTTVTFAPRAQTVSFTSTAPTGATVGGSPYVVAAAGGGSSQPVTFTLAPTSTGCTLSGPTITFTGVGTCVVAADQAGDAIYAAAPQVTQSIAVARQTQVALVLTSTGGDAGTPLTLTTSGGSGTGAVTFTTADDTASGCRVDDGRLVTTSSGTCAVTAAKAGDPTYAVTTSAPTTVTLAPVAQSVTFTSVPPASARVAGDPYTVTASGGGSGQPVTFALTPDSVGCSLDGATVSFVGVGTCVVAADQAGDAIHAAAPEVVQSFRVGAGEQTITFTSAAPERAVVGVGSYHVHARGGGSGKPVTFTLATGSKGCALRGAAVSFTRAGRCSIAADQAGDASYDAAPRVVQTFTVHPPAATTTRVQVSRRVAHHVVTWRFTVRVSTAGRVPTGRVVLSDGARRLGSARLVHGRATLSVRAARLKPGRQRVRATYSGTPGLRASSGTVVRTFLSARARTRTPARPGRR